MESTSGDYIAWKGWESQAFATCTPADARYFEAEVEARLRPIRGMSILEIGFGNGVFLGWARECGAICHGVELNPELCERARALGIITYASLAAEELDDQRESFGGVVAFDVLEHVPKAALPETMQRIRYLLKPGGLFVARFPNADSPFGRIYQHGDLSHQTAIGRHMAQQLAVETELELVSIGAPAYPIRAGAGYLDSVRRLLVGTGRRLVERAVASLFLEGEQVPLTMNHVAVWRRPEK